jgi:F0F1-type ATP synthase membrane subunit b/b'
MAEDAAKRQAELAEILAERINDGETRIEQAKNEAIGQLQDMSAALTAAAMERLVGERPSEAGVGAAVDAVLKSRTAG